MTNSPQGELSFFFKSPNRAEVPINLFGWVLLVGGGWWGGVLCGCFVGLGLVWCGLVGVVGY